MSITPRALLLAPVLLLLATGYTDCEYFGPVTVPASDPTPPTTYDGVYTNGQYVAGAFTGQGIEYHMTPGYNVLAVSSAIDDGGVRGLKMNSSYSYDCCMGSTCSRTQPSSVARTDSQAGGVGATVSNGLWLYSVVELPSCRSGYTLTHYRYSWWTEAENFHGRRVTGQVQSIVYP